MLGWRLSYKATPDDPTIVVSFKPCQSALTSKLVSMRIAMVPLWLILVQCKFGYTRLCLSVCAFLTRLISTYELAYYLLRVLILLLVLADVYCKSMDQ